MLNACPTQIPSPIPKPTAAPTVESMLELRLIKKVKFGIVLTEFKMKCLAVIVFAAGFHTYLV